jgi:hypothetical protein
MGHDKRSMQGKPDLPILIVNQELGSQACRRSDDYTPHLRRISQLSHQQLKSGNILVDGEEGFFITTEIP